MPRWPDIEEDTRERSLHRWSELARMCEHRRRISELVSGLTGTEVPRKGLRVRVPCPPLKTTAGVSFSSEKMSASHGESQDRIESESLLFSSIAAGLMPPDGISPHGRCLQSSLGTPNSTAYNR